MAGPSFVHLFSSSLRKSAYIKSGNLRNNIIFSTHSFYMGQCREPCVYIVIVIAAYWVLLCAQKEWVEAGLLHFTNEATLINFSLDRTSILFHFLVCERSLYEQMVMLPV